MNGGELTMLRATFDSTFASGHGGGVLAFRGMLTLYHTEFINTFAGRQGHAMDIQDAARVITAFVTIRNHLCTDANRNAGIITTMSTIALRNVTFDTPDCVMLGASSTLPIPS